MSVMSAKSATGNRTKRGLLGVAIAVGVIVGGGNVVGLGTVVGVDSAPAAQAAETWRQIGPHSTLAKCNTARSTQQSFGYEVGACYYANSSQGVRGAGYYFLRNDG